MDFFVCEYASSPENICECKICELDDNDSVCIYCKNNCTDYCDNCINND